MFGAPLAGLAALSGRDDPWSRWATGALLMSLGDFGTAWTHLVEIARIDDEVGGMACARLGSGLRQMQEHRAATAWDRRAQASSGQAVVDGLIGEAADWVGLGRPADAASRLAEARTLAATWRDHVRVGWVSTEIALLRGDTPAAVSSAQSSLRQSEEANSPRHIVKSELFWERPPAIRSRWLQSTSCGRRYVRR